MPGSLYKLLLIKVLADLSENRSESECPVTALNAQNERLRANDAHIRARQDPRVHAKPGCDHVTLVCVLANESPSALGGRNRVGSTVSKCAVRPTHARSSPEAAHRAIATSDIVSDIALEELATRGKRQRTDEKRVRG